MIRNFKRTASLLGVVTAGSLALVACSESENGGGSEGGTDASSIEGLSGTTGQLVAEGASSQQNAMDYFNVQYQEAIDGASLAYNPSGSGSGRTNFVAGQVAFAGSDSPLSDDQVQPAADRCGGADAWHLPLVIGPVAIAYNLEGVDEALNLSTETISQIFQGEITNWNDEAIAAENEGVELPDKEISVIYRSDESGTSDNFQKFLAANSESWTTEGQKFPSAVGAGANGSNGVATETAAVDGAITYVESGFAEQQNLGIANIDFGAGPVELNAETVGVALDNLSFLEEGHNMVVDSEAMYNIEEEGAYPLVLTTYEIVCSDYSNTDDDPETAARVKDFLTVALNSQDQQLEDSGYIPVTGKHHDRLTAAVEAIQ